ncbi:hypothetical protein [Mycolicibacterium sp.]|uniref:hypothetical protein n=1 Tax=Mycolicibacterium sp. TaxID=2320850 RepID=UPI003560BB8F
MAMDGAALMKVSEKLPYALLHLESIATHRDEDGAVRVAALQRVKARCDEHIAAIEAEVKAKIEATLPPG